MAGRSSRPVGILMERRHERVVATSISGPCDGFNMRLGTSGILDRDIFVILCSLPCPSHMDLSRSSEPLTFCSSTAEIYSALSPGFPFVEV